MIAKIIIIMTVLVAGISMSTASPTSRGAASSYVVSLSGEQIDLTEIVNLGNESSSNITGQSVWRYDGYLTVFLHHATGLWDKDGYRDWSDPYVELTAYKLESSYGTKRTTRVIWDTQNPSWGETLHFGHGVWTHFIIEICDYDWFLWFHWCDPLVQAYTVEPLNQGDHDLTLRYTDGEMPFEYHFN